MGAEDLLVHVHIDKTAGTSLWNWFGSSISGGHGMIYPTVPGSYYLDETQLAGIADFGVRSVSSHYFRLYPEWEVGRHMHYFTLLREPLSHYLSYCNYLRQIFRAVKDPEQLASLPPDADKLSARELSLIHI